MRAYSEKRIQVITLKRRVLALLLLLCITVPLTSCAPKLNRYEAQFLELFDTVTTVVGYSKDKDTFTNYVETLRSKVQEYHELYDIYNDYPRVNNIKTINDNAGVSPVKVDKRIIDLLKFSIDKCKNTGGQLNIALGAVLTIWHDYREAGIENPEAAKLPPMEDLQEAAKHTNIDDVVIDQSASTVFLRDPKMSLDVGAVAKGYACEQVAQEMQKLGFDHALLSLGGNVRAIGAKNDKGEPFATGIENPFGTEENPFVCVVNLKDMSLVTSGNYERYYTVNGKQYHHLIDPDTLFPAEYFTSITILCKDSGLADGLTTAVYNMPFEQGLQFIESMQGVEALWLFPDGSVKYSDGFGKYIKEGTLVSATPAQQ